MLEFSKKRNFKEKTTLGTILFTDIVGSSKLWNKFKNKMFLALQKHERLIYHSVKKYNGIVIKTIGDSFMIFFKGNNYLNSIKCAMKIQTQLRKHPIELDKKNKIKLRIGICYGPLLKQHVVYQGIRLKDYFGATVNIASRMESKASESCKIAFSINQKNINQKTLFKNFNKVLNSNWTIKIKDYTENCKNLKKVRRRSSRLIQGYECLDPKNLKGVGKIRSYLFEYH